MIKLTNYSIVFDLYPEFSLRLDYMIDDYDELMHGYEN